MTKKNQRNLENIFPDSAQGSHLQADAGSDPAARQLHVQVVLRPHPPLPHEAPEQRRDQQLRRGAVRPQLDRRRLNAVPARVQAEET